MVICGCLSLSAFADGTPDIEIGRGLAQANCGGCHAVEAEGLSAMKQAPPFRTFQTKWPIEYLEEALAEGIVSGHPDMPVFAFEPEQIDALIAYMKSLPRSPR